MITVLLALTTIVVIAILWFGRYGSARPKRRRRRVRTPVYRFATIARQDDRSPEQTGR